VTWTRTPLLTWCRDGDPIGAGTMVDLVRGNLRHLAGQPPAGSTAWPMNGVLQGGATDLDDSDAVIWRGGLRQVRAALGAINRSFEFRIGAYMTAGTGTLRAEVSTTWARGIGLTATMFSIMLPAPANAART